MEYNHLMKGARKILECGCIKPGEKVVFLIDTLLPCSIGRALLEAANEKNAIPTILTMNPVVPAGDLPDIVNIALKSADLIITTTSTSIYHSKGIKEACEEPHRARVIALSEFTEDAMMNGGVMADFNSLKPMIDKVLKAYNEGKIIRYTTPAGTDISASIDNRDGFFISGITDRKGMQQALPTVEVFIAPVEESVNGTIVVDASCTGGIGLVDEPITMQVENGIIVSIEGGKSALMLSEMLEKQNSPLAYQVAEYGVGLNPECRVVGTAEDEGRYGTCHFGIGRNTGFGGKNDVGIHLDVILWRQTIEIDGKLIFKDGECLI